MTYIYVQGIDQSLDHVQGKALMLKPIQLLIVATVILSFQLLISDVATD